MQIARMRALENGRWVLRGTNNGVTGIIDAQGNIRNTLPQFVSGVLRGEFKIMKGRTAYSELGDWPMLALIFVLLLIACFSRWRQSD
jgi:apolipoprotein N-acyltransferase